MLVHQQDITLNHTPLKLRSDHKRNSFKQAREEQGSRIRIVSLDP